MWDLTHMTSKSSMIVSDIYTVCVQRGWVNCLLYSEAQLSL